MIKRYYLHITMLAGAIAFAVALSYFYQGASAEIAAIRAAREARLTEVDYAKGQ